MMNETWPPAPIASYVIFCNAAPSWGLSAYRNKGQLSIEKQR
jgi:hypothetical protein